MNLLEKYYTAIDEYLSKERKFHEQLKPYKEKVDNLRYHVEMAILRDKLYMPYEDMIKLKGSIEKVSIIVQYGDGYEKIEKLLFNGVTIRDGKLVDTQMCPPRLRHIKDNVYEMSSCLCEDDKRNIKVLGCYDLEIDGKIVEASFLEKLWPQKDQY